MDVFKQLDIFGKDFKFNIEGGAFRTIFGGILSIFFSIGVIIMGFYFGKDVFYFDEPRVLTTQYILKEANNLFEMKNSTYLLVAARLRTDKQEVIEDPKYFEIIQKTRYEFFINNTRIKYTGEVGQPKAIYYKSNKCSYNTTVNGTTTTVNSFLPEALDMQKSVPDYTCADRNFSIGGPIPSQGFLKNYTALFFKYCDSDTEMRYGIICGDKKEFLTKYEDTTIWLEIIYQINTLNPKNYKYPISHAYFYTRKVFRLNLDEDLDNTRALHFDLYYNQAIIQTDKGLLSEELQNYTFPELNYVEANTQSPDDDFNYNYFAKISVNSSYKLSYYQRSYKKLQEIIADVGGSIGFITFFVQFIYGFYLENEYRTYLYNRMFSLQIYEEEKEEKENIKTVELSARPDTSKLNQMLDATGSSRLDRKFEKIPMLFEKNYLKLKNLEDNEIVLNKELKNLGEYREKKRKLVKLDSMSRTDIVCLPCKGNFSTYTLEEKLKYELVNAADKELEKKTEIIEIWSSANRLRLLEKLILNENQCYMLNNRGMQIIENSSISVGSLPRDISEDKNNLKKTKLLNYLEVRVKENKLTNVDKILFKYLDEEVKSDIQITLDNLK